MSIDISVDIKEVFSGPRFILCWTHLSDLNPVNDNAKRYTKGIRSTCVNCGVWCYQFTFPYVILYQDLVIKSRD